MAKALTQADLATWGCSEPHDHMPECSQLYFQQRCHPDVATWTQYDKLTGRAIVECAQCGREIVRLIVAAAPDTGA